MFENQEIKIDKENSKYKKLFRVLGIPLSDGWQKLPKIESVAITKRRMSRRLTAGISIVNSSTIGLEFYVVYLIGTRKNIKVEVCRKKAHKDAHKSAKKLAEYFSVKLIDYTQEK